MLKKNLKDFLLGWVGFWFSYGIALLLSGSLTFNAAAPWEDFVDKSFLALAFIVMLILFIMNKKYTALGVLVFFLVNESFFNNILIPILDSFSY